MAKLSLFSGLISDDNGCVIAINPNTGAIIAMVSKPDFDPNEEMLVKNWDELLENESNPFVATAT